ncbi:MAG TPA: methionyl-tRNA formyltransferase [Pyrinomonadaceae bacterium]|nr:methionyl-tRNA formyltransferase [Pyrinomonadaceae bacterium]
MRIVFMGTPEAAVPSLRRLLAAGHEIVAVWTQPDKPSGRGNKIAVSPVKQFATSQGLEVHQPSRIKTDEAKRLFASHAAELAVVVAYGRILPAEFLRAPLRGCLNVHFSLLPLYRGAAPVNWAIVNGERSTGVTTMFIEEQLDVGPILLQQKLQIKEDETAPDLSERLALIGADLLIATLAQINSITPRPQRERDATFAPMLKREDGLIRWTDSAVEIERCVRGFQPWPTAYTFYRSRRLIVWRAKPEPSPEDGAAAGQIVAAHGDALVVKCGKGTALNLLEIQPEAKRRMYVRDFMNGTELKVGDRFGEI